MACRARRGLARRVTESVAIAALLAGTLTPGTLAAQVCGDTDSSGSVSVTDGVRILRAAAGRGEPCALLVCDIDRDGHLTDDDGRLALRKAAGLSIAERCGTGSVSGTLGIPEPVPPGTAVPESEPNDAATVAPVVGPLAAGDAYTLVGAVDGNDDAFDGYVFVTQGGLTLDLDLRFAAAPDVDLDLLVDDRDPDGTGTTCEGTTAGFEACRVTLGTGPPRALDLVVVPAGDSRPSPYTLEVRAQPPDVRTTGPMLGQGAGPPVDVAVRAYRGLEADFVPDEIVVGVAGAMAAAPGVAGAAMAAARAAGVAEDLEPLANDPSGATLLRLRATGEAAAHALPTSPDDPPATKLARGAARARTRAAALRLGGRPDILYAHPNYLAHPARVPNDPLFARQWHYELIGLPRAWTLEIGNQAVVVAVIDTGIRPEHPDLRGKLVAGYDFIADPARGNDGDGIDPDPFDPGDRPDLPLTSSFHGTHVAGTIGAATDNGEGVAGVTWQTRIMPLRALGVRGGTIFDIAQAIEFAAGLPNVSGTAPDRPARVINSSLVALGDVALLRDAVARATAAGALVVAAAGNTASDLFVSPAGFEDVLSVVATDRLGSSAPYSNFGPRVDLAAPGGNTRVDLDGDGFPDGVLSTLLAGERPYVAYQGTSMACAHVSGIAALMLATRGTLSPSELRDALESTAQDRGPFGRDDRYGFGLVDPTRALRAISGAPPPAAPLLVLDTPALSFDVERSALAVHVTNAGGGTLELGALTITTDDGAPWLAARVDASASSIPISVDRSGLAPGGYGGNVHVVSNGGVRDVGITMRVATTTAVDVGAVHVRLIDPDTGRSSMETVTDLSQGYRYRLEGVPAGSYEIFAGTDRDADGSICDTGELCGAFPVLNEPESVTVVGGAELRARDFPLSLVAQAAD